MAAHQQPAHAIERFRQARIHLKRADSLNGLAAYDTAAALYYEGAYGEAMQTFRRLLLPKTALRGYSRRTCALWLKHASACAGYHAEREKLGIPEPSRLDPLCGVAGLAVCLRSLGLPYQKARLASACRHTGQGSTMQDLVDACPKLGVVGRAVTADEKGLVALPKPLVAYVEHDHFIAVVKADKAGVTYLCSDCGPWPGGEVTLTWNKWRKLEAGAYLAVLKKGGVEDRALSTLLSKQVSAGHGIRLAMQGTLARLQSEQVRQMALLAALRGHVSVAILPLTGLVCGGKGEAQHCFPWQCCDDDEGGSSGKGGAGTGHSESAAAYCDTFGASTGDPVNLATGEEEYHPAADLRVYNPTGPSITWSRIYNSLRGPSSTYEADDFGIGWSHPYNVAVYNPNQAGAGPAGPLQPGGGSPFIKQQPLPLYLILANGARVSFTANPPNATQPHVVCALPAGTPLLLEWDYDSSNGSSYFVITFSDRTKWVTTDSILSPGFGWYPVGQIIDRNGNAIKFNYTNPQSGFPLITSITDANNVALLTISRTGNNISAVSDRYGRSVYYHVGTYPTTNVPPGNPQSYQEVDQVSQVVATGMPNPPVRWQYGYQNVANGENTEQVPFLHAIGVPSPTGTGMATATVNYDPATDFVASLVDANGNSRSYAAVDANHTKVTVANAQSVVAYSYTAGFDNNMNRTSGTDGTNSTTTITWAYSDANDPYRPSSATDANGRTTAYAWDQYGNCQSVTSSRNTITTATWSYSAFPLGELASYQQGSKTAISFTYYEPSGLIHAVSRPAPGTVGGGTVTYSYTYDSLGNQLTATGPGNNSTASETWTSNYTNDGGYSQAAAINQPLTVTDPNGNVTHYRFDARGNRTTTIDALGNETDCSFDVADNGIAVTFPATNRTGNGRASTVNSFLYPGGPLTTTSHYNESGALVLQVITTFGLEGEVLSRSGSAKPVTQTYDADYRLIAITDGNNHSTQYSYSAAGYLSEITFPGNDTVQFTSYDPEGNLIQRIDGRGVVTNFAYSDAGGELSDVAYPATPTLNVHLSYDAYGRKSSVTDGTGSTTFGYDDDDAVTSVTTAYDGLPALTIAYGYYPDGSRQSVAVPNSPAYMYGYDPGARLTSLTNPANQVWTWTYLDNNWLASQNAAGLVSTTVARDSRGFPLELTHSRTDPGHTLLADFTAATDSAGNLGTITVNMPAVPAFCGATNFTHDTKLQLTAEQSTRGGGYSNSYVYDAVGNPTTFKGSANRFDADNQNTAYSFDGSGNPITYQGQTLTFDAESRLTGYGAVLTAAYRWDGKRAWKQTSAGRTYFFYDGDDLLFETDATGTVTAMNTVAPSGMLARMTGGRTLLYTVDLSGNIAQQVDSATGSVVASYMFDAYGTRGYSSSDSAALSDPYSGYGGATGYYTDWETGLQLLGRRYYDSATGRFVTRDPIGYQGGVNVYGYVANSPLASHDPMGTMSVWQCMLIGRDIARCAGEIAQLGFSLLSGELNGAALCTALSNCIENHAAECLFDAAANAFGWELGPIATGCLAGLLAGILHAIVSEICNGLNKPCEKGTPWPCVVLQIATDTLAGCLDGLAGEDAEQIIKFIIGFFLGGSLGLLPEACKSGYEGGHGEAGHSPPSGSIGAFSLR